MDTALGSWVSFATPAGPLNGFVVEPNGRPPWPALIVLHPVSGVSADVQELVADFAAEGYLALAPDLYTHDAEFRTHRTEDILAAAHMRQNGGGIDESRRSAILAAAQWIEGRSRGPIDFVRAAHRYLAERDDVALIGSVGYCMGGRLTAALAALGTDLAAGVIYYGGSPKIEEIPNIRCPLEGHYAVTDERITGQVYAFALAMKAAGKYFAYSVYDADHGFVHPPSHSYNPEATRLARERTSVFLAKHLKPELVA